MSKDLVRRQFGANAANYVGSVVHAKGASLGRMVELAAPKAHWMALDIATAAGHTALAFAHHVAHVTASDLTPEMLREADALIAAKGVTNVTTRLADAEDLPFADATFDLVTCRIAPHHFPDVARFIAESHRVLKADGTFALVDNVAPDHHTTPAHDAAALRHAAITYNAFEKLRDPSHGRALPTAEWLELAEAMGFAIRHVELLEKAMDFETWCRTMSVAEPTIERLAEMLDRADAALSAFLRPGRSEGSKRSFVLREIVLIATRG